MDDLLPNHFRAVPRLADKAGYFAKEIVPFISFQKKSCHHRLFAKKVTVSKDDGIVMGTTQTNPFEASKHGPSSMGPREQTTGGETTSRKSQMVFIFAAPCYLWTRQRKSRGKTLGLPNSLGRYLK